MYYGREGELTFYGSLAVWRLKDSWTYRPIDTYIQFGGQFVVAQAKHYQSNGYLVQTPTYLYFGTSLRFPTRYEGNILP